jgi:hypothetical protein
MVVALILLGLGGFVFPPLWLVFLVVLLAFLFRGKPTVIVVNQDGAVVTQPKPTHFSGLPLGAPKPAITALGRLGRYLRGDVICRVQVPDLSCLSRSRSQRAALPRAADWVTISARSDR